MTTEIELTGDQECTVGSVESAIQRAEAAAAQLRPNGQVVYAPDEERRRRDAIEAELDAALTRATEIADTAVAEAAATLERLTDTDPLDALTLTEQEAANRRAVFVREDAERLPLADLTRRVRQALGGSDRGMLYLWLRYSDVRLQAEQADGHIHPADIDTVRRLSEAVREAADRFIDHRAREKAEAKVAEVRVFWRRVFDAQRPLLVEREIAALRRSGQYASIS